MNGVRAGEWAIAPQGYDELTYDPAWLQSQRARPLSLSLPLQSAPIRASAVGAYFDNLLPDSESIRKRIQALRFPLKYMQHEISPLLALGEFSEHFWDAIAAANKPRRR